MTRITESLRRGPRPCRLPDTPLPTRAGTTLRILGAIAVGAWVVMTVVGTVGAAPASPWAPSLDGLVSVDGVREGSSGTLFTTAALDLALDDSTYRAGLRLMERSKRDAETAAFRCLDLSVATARVKIDSGTSYGPSAGLMFALEIIDRIERRDITRGRRVAGTGTIAPDGSVGAVGAIRQKVQAAEDVGADVFLVPASQLDDAVESAIEVDVIGVRDLDEALRRLRRRGCSTEA